MNSTYKIKTLGTGSKFNYGGISWVLLSKTKTAAVCLAEKILFNKAFDDNNNNNWAESTLRKHLNGAFLDELEAAGADKAAFLPFSVDLTADDGLKDYGKVTDKISLITCEQYRKHRYTMPNADDWWLTVTPYSTASNGYSYIVRFVYSSGALSYNIAYVGSGGVRPLCNLNSSILVSVTELKDYTEEETEQTEEAEEKPAAASAPQPDNSDRYEKHMALCRKLNETYIAKNNDYGNAFGDMFQEFGIITAITRIGDKFHRIKTLAKNKQAQVKEESIKDTLLDMANYCIMTVIEMEK